MHYFKVAKVNVIVLINLFILTKYMAEISLNKDIIFAWSLMSLK